MQRRLRTPSPALVISSIALFVALGGTTYAATSLPRNSVGTDQLQKNAVSRAKIRNGAVTAAKINTAGLTVPSALAAISALSAINAQTAGSAVHATSADKATNATKATSATSATTATTAATANALAGVQIVNGPSTSLAASSQADQTVTCPAGMVAIGGGQVNDDSSDTAVEQGSVLITTVSATDDSAQVFINNTGPSTSLHWNAYAVCIHGSASSP
jgi:hypothetical protein